MAFSCYGRRTRGDLRSARSRALPNAQVAAVIERWPSYRTLTPDPAIWREAGVLSGTLARTQGYGTEQRRRVLNDALLFATGRKYGCALLSRNVRDFDLLQQLDPSGQVMFYKIGAQ
jgi:predicted nucleic acid-binding protein